MDQHPPHLALRRRILHRVENGDPGSYRTIYNEECSHYSRAVQAQVPWKHIYPEMKAARVSLYGCTPRNLNEMAAAFAVPPYNLISATLDGSDNLMSKYITTCDGDSLILCSRRNLAFLNCVCEVVCPIESITANFKLQLLVLVGKCKGYAFPLIYCLMENCTFATYHTVLLHLKEINAQFSPHLVVTPYDSNLKQAWNTVFPNATVVDSFHHYFIQDLIDHIKTMPVNPEDFKEVLCMFCAIPLAPHEYLHESFKFVNEEAMQENIFENMMPLVHHIWEKWLIGTRYEMESVSVSNHELCSSNVGIIMRNMLTEVSLHSCHDVFFLIGSVAELEEKVTADIKNLLQGHLISPSKKVASLKQTNILEDLQHRRISIEQFIMETLSSLYPVLEKLLKMSQL